MTIKNNIKEDDCIKEFKVSTYSNSSWGSRNKIINLHIVGWFRGRFSVGSGGSGGGWCGGVKMRVGTFWCVGGWHFLRWCVNSVLDIRCGHLWNFDPQFWFFFNWHSNFNSWVLSPEKKQHYQQNKIIYLSISQYHKLV